MTDNPTTPGPPREVGVRLLGLHHGARSPLDGQWLVDYDPTRPGTGPQGQRMNAHIVCTPDPTKARRFPDMAAALDYVQTTSGRVRGDGQPDRPLTSYHLAIEPPAVFCMRCKSAEAVAVCCSSHNYLMCHRCYRRSHFVDRCGHDCEACAREGLDPTTRPGPWRTPR